MAAARELGLNATVLVALAACFACTTSCDTQGAQPSMAHSRSRDQAIRDEISKLGSGHPWAGVYCNGCGFDGDTLTMAPDAGFEWTYFDCIRTSNVGSGSVVERDGEIALSFASGGNHEQVSLSGTRFLVVPWGEDRFLVQPDRMVEFANDFNEGAMRRASYGCGVFVRENDGLRPRTGKPNIPPEYASMFLDQPIEARIIALAGHREERNKDWTYSAARVRLDVGADHGAFLGMVLRVQDPPLHNAYTIVELDAATSIAQRSRFAQTEPELGWRLSTTY